MEMVVERCPWDTSTGPAGVQVASRVGDALQVRLLQTLTPESALGRLSEWEPREWGVEATLESMCWAQRAASRAAWLQARHAARLAANDLFRAEDAHGEVNTVCEEISLALGVSRTHAERLVRVGQATTTGPLLDTGTALHAGDITFEVAWEFVRALTPVALQVALAVEAAVLPEAPGHTLGEVRAAIARALVEMDPDDADARHARARTTRGVTRPQVLPDGMARVSAFLPADDATALDVALDAAAVAARAGGDHRTSGQLRADTLATWAATALRHGTEVTLDTGATVHSHPAKVAVTVPLEVMLRALPGFTPPPSVGEVLAADISGEVIAAAELPSGPLAGHRTEAALLEGYGPIAPVIAQLLAAGGTWQRIVTDTFTGRPLDVGRARYLPPADIATALRVRDRHCTRPGCTIPAWRCDRDHVHGWADGGETSATNLTHFCRYHHRVKSLRLARPGPLDDVGQRSWTTITGRTYRPMRARPPRERSGSPPDPGQFEGPPPF
ncbi:MAG: DUF222 domain-containing protein [Actinomycetota bacterium]